MIEDRALAHLFDPFALALAHVALSRAAQSARDRRDLRARAAGSSSSRAILIKSAWKAIASGHALRIPVVGFYHSHFAEAYLRSTEKFLGQTATESVMDLARRYVRKFYNQFEATLVPSLRLARLLQDWGVENVRGVDLGVNTEVFRPAPDDAASTRDSLGIRPDQKSAALRWTAGAGKKHADAFPQLSNCCRSDSRSHFHLLVIGDGAQREQLRQLRSKIGGVTWIPYCTDSTELARYYRAADLFVHPGIQETFGLVALESQACGTPVVGIRGSYMDRIIFHEQGSWADENSPEALAEAIEKFSETKLQKLGEIASRMADERHAWDHVFKHLFRIYAEVSKTFARADAAQLMVKFVGEMEKKYSRAHSSEMKLRFSSKRKRAIRVIFCPRNHVP